MYWFQLYHIDNQFSRFQVDLHHCIYLSAWCEIFMFARLDTLLFTARRWDAWMTPCPLLYMDENGSTGGSGVNWPEQPICIGEHYTDISPTLRFDRYILNRAVKVFGNFSGLQTSLYLAVQLSHSVTSTLDDKRVFVCTSIELNADL